MYCFLCLILLLLLLLFFGEGQVVANRAGLQILKANLRYGFFVQVCFPEREYKSVESIHEKSRLLKSKF